MVAPGDDYPAVIEAAICAFVGSGVEADRAALESIAYPPRTDTDAPDPIALRVRPNLPPRHP
jgi:hypothetical protein